MKEYISKPTKIKAILVTVKNLEEVARLCSGSIIGTMFNRENQVIEFYNALHDRYLEVKVGEYLLLGNKDRDFYPCNAEVFNAKYELGIIK